MSESVRSIDDASGYVATVVLAFGGDPFVRWMLPEPQQFLTFFPELTRLHAEKTAAHGGAFGLESGQGAAFWYPPGVHPDGEALGEVFQAAGVGERVSAVWARSAEFEPEGPHWYLRQIGVDPVAQRLGLGAVLMQAGLAGIDARGDAAYLEATSVSSKALYERYGFVALGIVQAGDSAPLWPMIRQPV